MLVGIGILSFPSDVTERIGTWTGGVVSLFSDSIRYTTVEAERFAPANSKIAKFCSSSSSGAVGPKIRGRRMLFGSRRLDAARRERRRKTPHILSKLA